MFISERLKKCREEKKFTQSELMFELDKIGFRICSRTIANWEQGVTEPKPNELAILANFFNKPIQYFFDQMYDKTVMSNKEDTDK